MRRRARWAPLRWAGLRNTASRGLLSCQQLGPSFCVLWGLDARCQAHLVAHGRPDSVPASVPASCCSGSAWLACQRLRASAVELQNTVRQLRGAATARCKDHNRRRRCCARPHAADWQQLLVTVTRWILLLQQSTQTVLRVRGMRWLTGRTGRRSSDMTACVT